MARRNTNDRDLQALRAFGLAYPGAATRSPWPGHLDLAVNGKTFAFLGVEGEPFHITCKLPLSGQDALWLPFAKPAAYGLGRSGWVTAELANGEPVPVALFQRWIDESYRALAPKKLVAQHDRATGGGAATAPAKEHAKVGMAAAASSRTEAKPSRAAARTAAAGAASVAVPASAAGAPGKQRR